MKYLLFEVQIKKEIWVFLLQIAKSLIAIIYLREFEPTTNSQLPHTLLYDYGLPAIKMKRRNHALNIVHGFPFINISGCQGSVFVLIFHSYSISNRSQLLQLIECISLFQMVYNQYTFWSTGMQMLTNQPTVNSWRR